MLTMRFLTVSSKTCLEALPHSILHTPFNWTLFRCSPRAYSLSLSLPIEQILGVGTTPILEKDAPTENAGQGQMKVFRAGSTIPGIAPGVAPRLVVFVLLKS